MKSSALRPYLNSFPAQSTPLLPITPSCFTDSPRSTCPPQTKIKVHPKQASPRNSLKPLLSETPSKPKSPHEQELLQVSSDGFSRWMVFGAASLGIALFLVGIDAPKALAFGPEGPLVEEFWDNMRRYGLYIVTVSTGVIYTIFQPILDLLKNPISAILIITILGGCIYLISQVLSAMVGLNEFAYDYGY